ncbi:MAG: tyrosine-type recombinase/integrase [Candidatus Obscuribacter sp.]|nr:tyrosine-type recombinase/integrase [Candidatus Obscuribacter sp.]
MNSPNTTPLAVSHSLRVLPSPSEVPTLRQAFDDYCRIRTLRPKTLIAYRKNMKAIADWQDLKLSQITGKMCMDRFFEMKDGSTNKYGTRGFYFARQTFKVLHAIYEVARAYYEDPDERPLIVTNPVQKLTALRLWGKAGRRQDCVFPEELNAYFRGIQALPLSTERDYLTLILLTGFRASEAAAVQWGWVSEIRQTVNVPGDITKTGTALTYPLTALTTSFIDFLRNRADFTDSDSFLFPSATSHAGHISDDNRAYLKLKKISGVEVTRHGLRRTFGSYGDYLDISGYALRKLMNHADNSVTAGYVIATVDRMRRAAASIHTFMLDNIGVEPVIEQKLMKTGSQCFEHIAQLADIGLYEALLLCHKGAYFDASRRQAPLNKHLEVYEKLGLTLADIKRMNTKE